MTPSQPSSAVPARSRCVANEKSVLVGSVYTLVLTILLFWIPVIGPFVAGFVGGRKAGSPGAGLVATALPAIVAGVLVFLFVNAFPGVAPWLAALLAGALAVWLIIQAGVVLLGGLVGGWSAKDRERAATPAVR